MYTKNVNRLIYFKEKGNRHLEETNDENIEGKIERLLHAKSKEVIY